MWGGVQGPGCAPGVHKWARWTLGKAHLLHAPCVRHHAAQVPPARRAMRRGCVSCHLVLRGGSARRENGAWRRSLSMHACIAIVAPRSADPRGACRQRSQRADGTADRCTFAPRLRLAEVQQLQTAPSRENTDLEVLQGQLQGCSCRPPAGTAGAIIRRVPVRRRDHPFGARPPLGRSLSSPSCSASQDAGASAIGPCARKHAVRKFL